MYVTCEVEEQIERLRSWKRSKQPTSFYVIKMDRFDIRSVTGIGLQHRSFSDSLHRRDHHDATEATTSEDTPPSMRRYLEFKRS
jgi:hypothetical protein